MELAGLRIADDPQRWRALGFAVGDDGAFVTGGVRVDVASPAAGEEPGVRAWALRGGDGLPASLDGLATTVAGGAGQEGPSHPNTAVALDHVVVSTPDLDRTMAAFAACGLEARRVREAGELRQAFYLLGTALAEVAGPAGPPSRVCEADAAPATFWGLTFAVRDLDAAAALLGERLGAIRDAVQPGRRIATVRRMAGVAVPIALISARS